MLTEEIMHQMWPHGDDKVPGLIKAIADCSDAVFAKYGLTSDLVVAHAMAQFSHECGAGTEVVENLNYSAQGLLKTWPSRFDAAKAAALAHQPEKIANEVYNDRMGNQAGSDDGWKFRGRGGSQVTGRDGYTKLAGKVTAAVLTNPDLVNDPQYFLECAVADFVLCGCLPFAQHDDISGVTHHLNGGFIGLDERKNWLARWKAALHLASNGDGHSTAWLQDSLNKLGAEPALTVDGSYGPVTVMAVKEFQSGHGLQVDGKLGPATIDAIEKALGTKP